MKLRLLLPLLFLALSASAAAPRGTRHLIIVHAAGLPGGLREDLARRVAQLLLEAPVGSRVTVLDGERLVSVADVVIPEGSVRVRQQRVTSEIVAVVAALRGATNAGAGFNIPRVLDHVARQVRQPGLPPAVLLLGPALYRNPREPAFDLTARWPGDGHLAAGLARSVFSTAERAGRLEGAAVAWCVTDADAVVNEAHREGVLRFWTLFVGTQGGVLTAFSPDAPNVFRLLLEGRGEPVLAAVPDPADRGVVMHARRLEPVAADGRAGVAPVDALARAELPTAPPGDTGIGIVWEVAAGQSGKVDLDLYVQPPAGGPELYFAQPVSDFGRHHRDVRQAQAAGTGGDWRASWEFVELRGERLPGEAWINLFTGRGPVQGELRIQHRGRVERVRFTLPAVEGSHALGKNDRAAHPQWLRVTLADVLPANP